MPCRPPCARGRLDEHSGPMISVGQYIEIFNSSLKNVNNLDRLVFSETMDYYDFMWRSAHRRITERALKDVLGPKALRRVIRANLRQDLHQATSKFHFDNCAFAEGIEYINEQFELALFLCRSDEGAALEAFGRIIHALQDFYSHSNWIELFWPIITLWDETIPKGLVSGSTRLGKNKLKGAPHHRHLNKDRPGNKADRDFKAKYGVSSYELAFNLAEQHTKLAWERLTKLIKERYKKQAPEIIAGLKEG